MELGIGSRSVRGFESGPSPSSRKGMVASPYHAGPHGSGTRERPWLVVTRGRGTLAFGVGPAH
jgi:hypothetical protein